MCYSAQILQTIRRLRRELNVHIDYHEALKLFLRRLDDPGITISRGFENNFTDPATEIERQIKAAIDEHRARQSTKAEQELFKQKTRLVNAERSLQAKETKKAREDVRIAGSKIEALTDKLSRLRRNDSDPEDDRIFPMHYAGVIIRKGDGNVLTPMRYHCRPAGKLASIDRQFPGLYNARRDNIEKFWRAQFGTSHAVMVAESFYENVDREGKNVVLQFQPQPRGDMLIACLYSRWVDPKTGEDLLSFAAVTDEPPPEVAAAGHDRMIVNLKRENVDAWLSPVGRSDAELQALLEERERPFYEYQVEAA